MEGNATTATTAMNVSGKNITELTSEGNEDQSAFRHIWFSDKNTETARISSDNFVFNPVTMYLEVTGGTIKTGTFIATSDKRLKENITPYNCEKSILDLPVYKYNFISDASKKEHIGCLAQDLQEICPEIVHEGNDGYLSINESKIVYLLLEEVKQLRKEINELKR